MGQEVARITLELSPELKAEFVELVRASGKSQAFVLRTILREWCRKERARTEPERSVFGRSR